MTDIKKEENMISDITDKTMVSARVNTYIIDQYKESEIPISLVIEASLINFMRLEDNEKIKFISNNLAEKVKVSQIKKPNRPWKKLLSNYFEILSVPSTITSGLLTGLCVGAVALVGGMLTVMGDKLFDDK